VNWPGQIYRDNYFRTMADTLSYLEECVNATEACVKTVSLGISKALRRARTITDLPVIVLQQDRAIAQLQKGIQDLPRLTKILHNERVSPRFDMFALSKVYSCFVVIVALPSSPRTATATI
jgi:hypothetical protein